MNVEPYPVHEVKPEWVLEPEALGSKEKFWYRANDGQLEWLFKFPQPNTGQHWSEKIAEQVASCFDVLHARVELAVFDGQRGSSTESFARDGRNLFHGNQILAGKVLGYDPQKEFRNCDHTLANVFAALERTFTTPEGRRKAKSCFADYMVLDALIGNTDRHHENWGILQRRVGDRWQGLLAPTFDHASSLGRELLDDGSGKSRRLLMRQHRVGAYSEKGSGAIYWDATDRKGLSPLELVRRATMAYGELFAGALARLARLNEQMIAKIVNLVPEDWMSECAREFSIALMCYNLQELRKITL